MFTVSVLHNRLHKFISKEETPPNQGSAAGNTSRESGRVPIHRDDSIEDMSLDERPPRYSTARNRQQNTKGIV